MNYELRVVKL